MSLAVDLGIAEAWFGKDPDSARSLVARAHADAKAAIEELRGLVRGIHPSVLDGRGLDTALSALIASSPAPRLGPRPGPERLLGLVRGTVPRIKGAAIGPLMNKLRAFLLRRFARQAIAAGPSTFDMSQVLDSGGLCVARLPKGILGEETVQLVGSFIVARTWQAARLPRKHGQPCGAVPAPPGGWPAARSWPPRSPPG